MRPTGNVEENLKKVICTIIIEVDKFPNYQRKKNYFYYFRILLSKFSNFFVIKSFWPIPYTNKFLSIIYF